MVEIAAVTKRRLSKRAKEIERTTTLSDQEAEVYVYKDAGYTHAEIAELLGIEKGTVDSVSHRITKKKTLAYTTTQELMAIDELEPWDFSPLLGELIQLARSGKLEDATIMGDLETKMLSLEDGRVSTDYPPDYKREKNLLVTE